VMNRRAIKGLEEREPFCVRLFAYPCTKGCTEQERRHAPLGQKLNESNGVICAPDIDPGMSAPTPDGGKTPVIPPPGSPGGNANVQPK